MITPMVTLGPGSLVEDGARVGYAPARTVPSTDLVIGAGAQIRCGTVVYAGSTIGDHLSTGHNVVIREQCTLGDHVSVWSGTVIDYGCVIGDRVKIHTNCYISQFTVLEDDVFIAPGVSLANDLYPGDERSAQLMAGPVVERGAQIGVGSTLLPYVRIGAGAIVGSGSVVTRDVAPGMVVVGNPARVRGPVSELRPIDERVPSHPLLGD